MKAIKLPLIISICLISAGALKAQDCKLFALSKEGAQVEMTSYDAKNKITGKAINKVISKENIPGGVKITIESEHFDKKGKSEFKGKFDERCENGVFYLDMSSFISPESMKNSKDQKYEIKSDNLEMPSNMTVGQTLKDGSVTIAMVNNDPTPNPAAAMLNMNLTINVKNRKVEAIETITTPAGSFECYKISSTVQTKMMFNVESKAVDWIAKEVGVVKSESYDKRGKLQGSMVLTSIKN
jgi:hypothetical protein